MTVAELKRDLPDVHVRLPNGRIVMGIVTGRQLPFARVYLRGNVSADFAWDAVLRVANGVGCLVIDCDLAILPARPHGERVTS